MNKTRLSPTLLAIVALSLATAKAAPVDPSDTPDKIHEFLADGTVTADVRTRYEKVTRTNTDDSNPLTFRTRAGYTTVPFRGLQAMVEFENVASPFPNAYNQAGMNEGGASKVVVNDPTGTDVDQAWLGYTFRRTTIRAGRQRLVLDNGRFVGDDSWRQHMQTFDAAVFEDTSIKHLDLTYAYIFGVNRVVGNRNPQGHYEATAHVIHASYNGLPWGTITGYTYLFRFGAPVNANSTSTWGFSFDGSQDLDPVKVLYRAEFAHETDYANSPLSLDVSYLNGELGLGWRFITAGIGYELQGSDDTFPFRAPLGSLSSFNGWADAFPLVPTLGLRDLSGKVSLDLPRNFGFTGAYHKFSSNRGVHLGNETDFEVTYQINHSLDALVRYASFRTTSTTMPDLKKISLQIEMSY